MILKYGSKIIPKLIMYKLASYGLVKPPLPILLNFSVTNMCQSRCSTCNIWQLYKKNPKKRKEELTLNEIEKVFQDMDDIFLLNICGGEPTLRKDLPDICHLACKYIHPEVIHFPTNCLDPRSIKEITEEILKKIPPQVHLTVKLSLDGIGRKHDEIRGVLGNFKKLLKTHDYLVDLRNNYKNLYLDAGTTISLNNIKDLPKINDYVKKNLKLDNFLHEIADTRAELFNVDLKKKDSVTDKRFLKVTNNLKVTPSGSEYDKVVKNICNEIIKDMKNKRKLSKITQALRLVYYKRAAKTMINRKRMSTCYAGISNAHLNPWGDLWICNVQAFKKSMGNVRDYGYNFKKLWYSKNAKEIRKWVSEKHCYCPLVGQSFLDTIMNPIELIKVLYYYIKY
ncbi:radical SAM protein [Candidatus Woesearchaeota archaeon B3_Woes]|nr:MAG: radical SAM protein [Candidatus Woesearchaeota archaeon B3_Woes]